MPPVPPKRPVSPLPPHKTHEECDLLTQFSLTRSDGLTSVHWIGAHYRLEIGQRVKFFFDDLTWTIDSRWTTLPPNSLIDGARIGFVEEIYTCTRV